MVRYRPRSRRRRRHQRSLSIVTHGHYAATEIVRGYPAAVARDCFARRRYQSFKLQTESDAIRTEPILPLQNGRPGTQPGSAAAWKKVTLT
jgi:hypothetical protein